MKSKIYAITMNAEEKGKNPLRLKSIQVFLVAGSILLTLIITVLCMGIMIRYEVDSDIIDSISYWNDELPSEQQFWYDKAIDELNHAMDKELHKHKANNVIVFVANGISPEALANVRFKNGKESGEVMSWEKFPYYGKLKNDCSGKNECDHFTASTALYGGVKTNSQIGGLDSAIKFRDCSALSNKTHYVKSILEFAQEINMRTGFVTMQRVTASTVAALYAHTPDTSWECDANMPREFNTTGCTDIAQQLITTETGKAIHVIMGGGRQTLVSNVPVSNWDPIDENACKSLNNRNLIHDWQQEMWKQSKRSVVLRNKQQLNQLNGTSIDYALGIFANGNIKADVEQMPQLNEMVSKAMDILKKDKSNFLLIVETGEQAESSIQLQTQRLIELNQTIKSTLESHKSILDDTLIVVLFTNCGSSNDRDAVGEEINQHLNANATANDDELAKYMENIITDSVMHAIGPRSHIFNGLHESTYMAHAISHALEMGQFKENIKGNI